MRRHLATASVAALALVGPGVVALPAVAGAPRVPPAPATAPAVLNPDALEPGVGPTRTAAGERRTASDDRRTSAMTSAGYRDFCDDGGGVDVAGLDVTDDGAAAVSVRWSACFDRPLTRSGAEVRFTVVPLGAAATSHVLTHRLGDGSWRLFATGGSRNEGTWTLLQSGTAPVGSVPQPNGEITFDASAADLPTGYRFELASYVGGVRVDLLPDRDMPATAFPDSCDVVSAARYAVTTTGPDATARLAAALGAAGYRVTAPSGSGLEVTPSPGDLAGFPGVVGVAPVRTFTVAATDDPSGNGWAQDLIRLDAAHAVVASSPATVAVVDQGVNGRLSEFGGRVAAGINAVSGGTFPAGANSTLGHHGTLVATIIGATHSDGVGTAGVNNGVTIVPVLVSDHATCITDPVLASAVDRAVASDVDVVNLSLSGPGDSPILREAVARAVDAGVLVVAATGNHGTTQPHYPANYPGVIGVGATGRDGSETSYSGRTGAALLAPGGDDVDPVLALDRYGTVTGVTGTSFATPYVAGVASLIVARTDDPGAVLLDTAAGRLLDAAAAVAAVPAPRPTLVPVDTTATCAPFVGDGFAFADADGGSLEPFVRCVAGLGVSQGFPDGTFRGTSPLTLEQTAAFVLRALEASGRDVPAADEVPDAYTTDDGTFFEAELNRLAAIGVPDRPGDVTDPTEPMTRAAMAEWISSALRAVGAEPATPLVDVFPDDDGLVRESYVDDVASFGVVTGTGDGTYAPRSVLTRGEMSVFLSRVVALLSGA